MLKIKEGVIKSSFFIFVHPFKLSTQPLTITTLKLAIQLKYHQKNFLIQRQFINMKKLQLKYFVANVSFQFVVVQKFQ